MCIGCLLLVTCIELHSKAWVLCTVKDISPRVILILPLGVANNIPPNDFKLVR